MNTNLVAIDLAKKYFQVCVLEGQTVLSNRRLTRLTFQRFIQQLPPTTIAMESCASAHYWGRTLQAVGHRVLLVPPQHAKAFRRVHKSDQHDALSIAEAAMRPNIHFVPVKSQAQQDLQLMGRIRERLTAQRTAIVNQARGLAREYGVEFPKQRLVLMRQLPIALEDASNDLSTTARQMLHELLVDLQRMDQRIAALQHDLDALAQHDPAYERLRSIPGIGPLVASALLAAMGDGSRFQNGRQAAAWVGLVPKQNGTGGKVQLLGISKNGNRSLRTLLIHGARSVLRWADKHNHAQSQWLLTMVERRGKNRTAVALANKMMRIAWSVITTGECFDMNKAYA